MTANPKHIERSGRDEPDIEEAARFLAALAPGEARFTFQTFDDNKERKDKRLVRVLHGTLAEHAAELMRLNWAGAGIFVTINETDLTGRATSNIRKVRALFSDLDGSPLIPVLAEMPPPHIVVETSKGKWHVYWRVSDVSLDEFKSLQKALIDRCRSDPAVHDLPRVMRLPGFAHQKVLPRLVRIERISDAPPYSAADLALSAVPQITGAVVGIDGKPSSLLHRPATDAEPGISTDPSDRPKPPTIEEAKAALAVINPDIDNDSWFHIGGGLYNTFGPELGFKLWNVWSSTARQKYAPKEMPDVWQRIVSNKGYNCTFGTIVHHAQQGDKYWRAQLADKAPSEHANPTTLAVNPYVFPNETTLPRWEWLYGKHLLRKTVCATVAMGGTGKSSKSIVDALAMASGKPLLGVDVPRPLRVLLINLEDNRDAMDKRIVAAMKHHGLTTAEIGERMFVVAKGEVKVKVAVYGDRGRIVLDLALRERLSRLLLENQIDVLSIDPFVKTHGINENDNGAIQQVVEFYDDIAEVANCAVILWHHTRKSGGNGAETTVEVSRGAGAFIDTCRSVNVLERMTKAQAEEFGLSPNDHLPYFREFSGKLNFAPPADQSKWYKIEDVELANNCNDQGVQIFDVTGDRVGVVAAWARPGTTTVDVMSPLVIEQIKRKIREVGPGLAWREDTRAAMYVGKAVAEVLGVDHATATVKTAIRRLQACGVFRTVRARDPSRNLRTYIVLAEDVAPETQPMQQNGD